MRTLLIMAGGTGGHIFPALAVADYLRAENWRVVWLGTRGGMEADLVPKRGYDIAWLTFAGMRGKGWLRWMLLPLLLLLAMFQSVRAIFRHRPDVVLGMGGYAAFPGGMMAVLLARPLVIHEQNSIAGLTNRVLAVVADRVLAAFPSAFEKRADGVKSWLPRPRGAEWCGNPVRVEIAALPAPEARFAGREGPLRVLVVGGSRGAAVLNQVMPQALAAMPAAQRPQVRHQAGAGHAEALREAYRAVGAAAEVQAFLTDMADAYASCDVVICRAGALTVAELAAAGIASVLVPFPYAVDDHQTHNAHFLSDAGAALLLPQGELSATRLAQWLASVTREQLLAMAVKARTLGKADATRLVARACQEAAGAEDGRRENEVP
ncbi:MAG TPA: undecaprenyldiphospho-muramoylpentapeptide beta-N-acetylglucosaminyltransferase [Betaproteobacteria bacterium]|nr:undecaprenyldiphospho-muramoylpentapeptide beta-N-acetylglucosaminyltransferase [Betaproteobacteria bacterium]